MNPPESLTITRNKTTEAWLLEQARQFVTRGNRAEGIHASDLLSPRIGYWRINKPLPITDRQASVFTVGLVLHAFVLSSVEGKTLNWSTDEGQKYSERLKLWYSPDKILAGKIRELKTSRAFKLPKDSDDLDIYLEQLFVYMAAEQQTQAELWVLYLNVRDAENKTRPEFRVYTVSVTPKDLARITREVEKTRKELESAVVSGDWRTLPLCREFMCGKGNCSWYDDCQPEGRYGTKKFD